MSLLAPPIACMYNAHIFLKLILSFGGKKSRNKLSNKRRGEIDKNHLILIKKTSQRLFIYSLTKF